MASNDPAFEAKAADIVGLYLARQPMAPSSAWTKRAPSRPSTDSILCCRFLRDGPSVMVRVFPSRHPLPLCRPRDPQRPGHRKHCQPPHQPGVCPLSPRGRSHAALRQGNPPHRGQPLRPQNQARVLSNSSGRRALRQRPEGPTLPPFRKLHSTLVPVDDPLWGERVLQLSSQLRGKTVGPATLRDHRITIDPEVGARASLCSDHAWFGSVIQKTYFANASISPTPHAVEN